MAMIPRLRSSGVSNSSVLSAPRSLKEAVNCWFSNFTQTSAWVMRDSVSLRRQGVRTTAPAMRAAAARTSARVTDRTDVMGAFMAAGLEVRHLAVELPVAVARRLGAGRAADLLDLLDEGRGLGRLGLGGFGSGIGLLAVGHETYMNLTGRHAKPS